MYRDMNDYEILYMVCDERENNFDILLQKYKPLIYKIVKLEESNAELRRIKWEYNRICTRHGGNNCE